MDLLATRTSRRSQSLSIAFSTSPAGLEGARESSDALRPQTDPPVSST